MEFGEEGATAVAPKPRTMLALLLVRANAVVPVDLVVDEVWGERPPPSARDNVRLYATVLRRLLAGVPGGPTLTRRGPAYLLTVEPAALDVHVFRELAGRAGQAFAAGEPATASTLLDQALELWRGPALTDVPVGRILAQWQVAVEEERLRALEEHAQVLLDLGATGRAAGRARELLDAEPLRERGHELLVCARYGSGDIAGALAALDAARRVLHDELGMSPGERLRELQRAILNREPAPSVIRSAPPAPPDGPAAQPVPHDRPAAAPASLAIAFGRSHCLPRAVTDFIGRRREVRELQEFAQAGEPGGPAVAAVAGMPGVGKTAIALRVAHLLADGYPDAQLLVDLRGHTPGAMPLAPGEALGLLLGAVGVPGHRIPAETEERAARWRAELADRRTLIILDNAASAAQVQPLLPGRGRHLVIVTSRRRLTDLDDARSWSLPPLAEGDAIQLFKTVAGEPERTRDAGAVAQVAALCGYLPLAIRLVATRFSHRPAWTLDHLIALLADGERGRVLHQFGDGRVRSAFTVSYQDLDPARRRMFRLLSLLPGQDWDAPTAAALAGTDPAQAESLLEDLLDANLLEQKAAGRYHFHNLLHQHARDLTRQEDEPAARTAGLRRLMDHYRELSAAAARLIDPDRWRPPFAIDASTSCFPDLPSAMGWLDTEHGNIVAAVETAARHGWDDHTWQLSYLLWRFFNRRGYVDDWISVSELGAQAAARLADRRAHAAMLNVLGIACDRGGRCARAAEHYEASLKLLRGHDDELAEADAHNNLGIVYGRLGRDAEALDEYRLAWDLYRLIGRSYDAAMAVSNLGEVLMKIGCVREAMACHRHAHQAARRLGDTAAEAMALTNLGEALALLGRHHEALEHYRGSLELRQGIGATYDSGYTLIGMGKVYAHLGDRSRAADCRREALTLMIRAGDKAGQAIATDDLPPAPQEAGAELRRKAAEIFARLCLSD
ncbi:MAG TPA: BTAD domain-containing putative transcriptional regulator [Nonomuraea sp.]|nr:BTAD domain-containing putative transcriptional regulator [Nonomuraea sp.]